MYSKSGLVLAVAILAFGVVSAHKKPEIKCLGKDVDVKFFFAGFMECGEKLMPAEDVKKFKDPNTSEADKKEIGKKAHENLCIRVCQWKEHSHMITADNKLNDTALAAIDSSFPEEVKQGLKDGVTKCFADHSSTFSDADLCKGYQAFDKCIHDVYKTVCKVDKMEMDPMEA